MKRNLFKLAILAVIALLAISNPKIEDFFAYVEKAASRGDKMSKLFLDMGKETKKLALKEGVERKSYFLFSVFKISDETGEETYKILGFAQSIFIPLTTKKEPEDIGII